jgi:CubicO group peptidase (beta-lactamase class C family)
MPTIPAPDAGPLSHASPERVGLSSARLRILTAYFANEIARGRVPGVVMLVARKGGVAYFETLGMRNPGTGAAMTGDSIFRIWSMTKPFVAVAAMMLVEEGKLSLNELVSKYLPEWKQFRVSIETLATDEADHSYIPPKRLPTINDLLRHTAGLPYAHLTRNAGFKGEWEKADLEPSRIDSAEFLRRVTKLPLASEPGTAFEYGHSTDVLGRVIEVVSGMRLSTFLDARVFRPLGMPDSGFHVPPEKKSRLAQPFDRVPGTDTAVPPFDPGRKPAMDAGGGRGVSTATDYLRFCRMLLNKGELDGVRILMPETLDLMTTDHLGAEITWTVGPGDVTFGTPGYTYGLGFGLRRGADNTSVPSAIGEYMWTGTANTAFFVYPREELIGIFLSAGVGLEIRMDHRRAFKTLVHEAIDDGAQ